MRGTPETQVGWQLYAVGSAVFAALTAILGKVGVSEINSNLGTLIRTVVILFVALGIVMSRAEWEPLAKVSWPGVLTLVASGIATGLSWLCYYRALQMAPASSVAPVDKLSVVIVIVLAAMLLGEPVTPRLIAGGVLVTAGVVIISWN